jgi:DNA polymerase
VPAAASPLVKAPAPAPVPDRPTLPRLRAAAAECRACDLWAGATQTVFGEGKAKAKLFLVGEQPGDREDREGAPFVGPAGRILDRALEDVGVARDDVYVTNAVKHFRYQERGKRRIHQRPSARHIAACRPWLDAELDVVKPKVLVCLGAVAVGALLGTKVKVTKDRGRPLEAPDLAPAVLVTVHPSAVLRSRDDDERRRAYGEFRDDLAVAAELVRKM